jgi:hypothetical protein
MKPTLTIFHQVDNSERIAFECDHAKTMADHIGGDGDSLRAAVQYALTRHTETCRCAPEVVEGLWESLAYMRATTERDLATVDLATVDPRVLALSHAELDSMRRLECPCDPHVLTTAELGLVRFTVHHRDGCKRKSRKGRRFRMLDFSSEATA